MKYELASTPVFDKWLRGLKDRTTRNKVLARLDRVENGNFGDCKTLDANLFELRLFFAGGLRIYYTVCDGRVVLLLSGGNKSSQRSDIERARRLIDTLE